MKKNFPLTDAEIEALFAEMRTRLCELYYAEAEALAALREAGR